MLNIYICRYLAIIFALLGGNEKIASIFEEMSVVQKLKRDRFRSQAYAKAAQALRAHKEVIDSGAQAKAIAGIGAGMASRIDAPQLKNISKRLQMGPNGSHIIYHIMKSQ